jgi:hypothetical protein
LEKVSHRVSVIFRISKTFIIMGCWIRWDVVQFPSCRFQSEIAEDNIMTLCIKMDVTGPLSLLDDEVQLSLSNALGSDDGQLSIKAKELLRARELEFLVVLEVTFRKVRESFEEFRRIRKRRRVSVPHLSPVPYRTLRYYDSPWCQLLPHQGHGKEEDTAPRAVI